MSKINAHMIYFDELAHLEDAKITPLYNLLPKHDTRGDING